MVQAINSLQTVWTDGQPSHPATDDSYIKGRWLKPCCMHTCNSLYRSRAAASPRARRQQPADVDRASGLGHAEARPPVTETSIGRCDGDRLPLAFMHVHTHTCMFRSCDRPEEPVALLAYLGGFRKRHGRCRMLVSKFKNGTVLKCETFASSGK